MSTSKAERADFSSLAVMYCPFEIFETCDKELLVVVLLLVGVVGYVLLVGLAVVVEYGFGIVLGSITKPTRSSLLGMPNTSLGVSVVLLSEK